MDVAFIAVVIGLSLAGVASVKWFSLNTILIGIIAYIEGYAITTMAIAVTGPFWANAVVAGLLVLLARAGYFDGWTVDLEDDDEFQNHAEKLKSWELSECREMSEDEDEYREMVITWAEQNR